MPRINIDVTADDQADGELVARLITANLSEHGFDDVTNTSGPTHQDKEEEVVEAMRNLSPEIFSAEIAIEVNTFDETVALAGVDEPGTGEFPDPDDDDAADILDRDD